MMKVLSKKELVKLLKVPTTVEQAQQIKRRNQGLLTFALKMKKNWKAIKAETYDDEVDYTGFEGCPHCKEADGCENCSWQKYGEYTDCGSGKFGGLTCRKVLYTRYGVGTEGFNFQLDCYPLKFSTLSDSIRFLRGHIEWANAVLKKGGVR